VYLRTNFEPPTLYITVAEQTPLALVPTQLPQPKKTKKKKKKKQKKHFVQ
jgi:hypothetical protein